MPEKSMKEKLAAGELVLCMNLRLGRSVDIAMVAKAGGYDAIYVDMQHAPYSIEMAATICTAALGIGITPLVRVPGRVVMSPKTLSRLYASSPVCWPAPDTGPSRWCARLSAGGKRIRTIGPVPRAQQNSSRTLRWREMDSN